MTFFQLERAVTAANMYLQNSGNFDGGRAALKDFVKGMNRVATPSIQNQCKYG